jgi:predicted phosphodiesterase
LQNVSKTAITIAWETDCLVVPYVNYGATASYGSQAKGICISHNSVYTCKVRITGLSPQTTYHFSALNGATVGADGTFTTAPNDETPFTFAVWGDSQQVARRLNEGAWRPECTTAIYTDMVANADIAVSVGDIVDASGYSYYTDTFRTYTCNVLGKQKPFFVAFGNHDEPFTSIVHKAVQNSGMNSSSFNYGNAHFTCISYSDYADGTLPLAWIEQDLASDDAQNATWRFFFIHVPPYCERWFDGSLIMQQYLVPLLNQYNVQICFSGHTHEYERGMLNGTFYVITGVNSYLDINESITEDWPFMTVGGAQNIPGVPEGGGLIHGWNEVEIDGTELILKMHAYNLNGSSAGVIDTVNFA